MKKTLSLLIVLVMLLSLCACRKNNTESTNSDVSSDPVSSEITDDQTTDTPDDEQTSSEITLTPDKDEQEGEGQQTSMPDNQEDSIKQPTITPDKDEQVDTVEPVTPPTDEETDESSNCEHSYTTVSCSCPKYCTKCEHIAANALPHNYQNGKCTVCGWSEIAFNIKEGNWVANIVKAGTGDQGEVLSQYILTQNSYAGAIVCYSNANACTVNWGKVFYNEKTYYVDYYYLAFTSVDWEENDDIITVTSRHSESAPKIVLTKMSETQLMVIESNDTAYIPVGTIFKKQ